MHTLIMCSDCRAGICSHKLASKPCNIMISEKLRDYDGNTYWRRCECDK